LPKYHVDSIQNWAAFEHAGKPYDLSHLDCHEVVFKAHQGDIRFVVTYGLHCFTKDGTEHNIPFMYADGRHSQAVCLERYHASKQLRHIIEQLDQGALLYHQEGERFFTLNVLNSLNGRAEPYKVCLAVFREHRLLRIHVTSAYFARTGEGASGVPVNKKGFSIFKVALDTQKKPKGQYPKEVRNRPKP